MAYIYGQRSQYTLFPRSIDEYVGEQDPVRVYDAFINELNFQELGISLDPNKGGPNEYNPKIMLKILVYGYANNTRSSRKLELACHRDISFIWLTSGLVPDYRTIARFRKDHTDAIRKVLREVVRLCIRWDLIEGNALFIDSTAMEANASIRKTFTREKAKERLSRLDAHIDKLLKESERLDKEQENQESLVKVKKELLNLDKIRTEVQAVEQELKQESLKELNTTDRDCATVKSSGRCRAGYRAHTSVDDKHGLIVSTDVIASATDANKLSGQIQQASESLGTAPSTVISDSGYCSPADVLKIAGTTTVIMPTQQQVTKERLENKENPSPVFTKDKFQYTAASDSYVCPAGNTLKFCFWSAAPNGDRLKNYRLDNGNICASCQHFGRCTTDETKGRKITRYEHEAVREQLNAVYRTPQGQQLYIRRKIRSELPFAQIKHNGGVRRFLLRGSKGVNAEFALLAVGHNMIRMVTILGITGILAKIQGG